MISAVWLMSPKSMIPVIRPASSVERVVDGEVGVDDLRAQRGQTGATRALESVEHAGDDGACVRVADGAEHRRGPERVLDVPDHHAVRAGCANPRSACPRRAAVSPQATSAASGRRGGADAAVAGQHVVEPDPVHGVAVAPLGAQRDRVVARACRPRVAAGRRSPRQRDAQARIDRGDVQRGRAPPCRARPGPRTSSKTLIRHRPVWPCRRNVRSRSEPRSRAAVARTPNSAAPSATASPSLKPGFAPVMTESTAASTARGAAWSNAPMTKEAT